MRILQLAPPWLPVPWASGSEYLVPGLLSDGLVHGGHEVTLVASHASRTRARLLDVLNGHSGVSRDIATLLPHVMAAFQRRGENDVVHDHTELGPALATFVNDTPTVHTLHYPLTDVRRLYLGQVGPRAALVAASHAQASCAPELPIAAVIHHGVRPEDYPLATTPDGYLAFVGSASPDGGAEEAIVVAEQLGVRLRMALDVSTPAEREHWATVLRPRVDGPRFDIVFSPERLVMNALLGGADALLVTGSGTEPFPLAAVEANACGTPVVGFAIGALPEVVEDGVNGFLVAAGDHDLLCAATERATWLDRSKCRAHVVEGFSATRMLTDYHALYRSAVETGHVSPGYGDRSADSSTEAESHLEWASTVLTAAGHDLRNPLTTIVGLAETLIENGTRLDADSLAAVQRHLLSSCRRLRSTLDDLLDVRHVMRRVGSLAEPVDLAQLVSDVAADLAIDDHLLDVDLRVPECLADRIGLKHIVGNLVSNALEQSDESQVVTIRSFPDQTRPGMTTIAVEDRGPGVPDDRKQSLFLPSLDDIRDGIGLAIVSALTQLERGQLWVTDRPGGGASFRVSLPNRPAVSTAPRADEKQPQLVRSDDSLAVD